MTITCPVCGKSQDVPKDDESVLHSTSTFPLWEKDLKMICPPCREKAKSA